MDKDTSKIAIFCCVLASISVAYYFFWDRPKQEALKLDLEKQKIELQRQEQEHKESIENQKLEADRIETEKQQAIESQKIQMQKQALEDKKTESAIQKNLLDKCLAAAERILQIAFADSCPGYSSIAPGETVTCKQGSESLIDSATNLRDQKVKECYQQYPQK